jgi:hypothetical protein
MFRSMASIVSVLSDVVAKRPSGRASVSSSPSKIPYGGFSPVRLQIDIPPRPSSPAHTRWSLIRGPQSVCPAASVSPFQGNRRTESALGNRPSGRCRSRGPWLPGGLYCPAGSSLIMASSEALAFTRRLMHLPSGLAKTRDSPIYSAYPSLRAVSRTPADRTTLAVRVVVRGGLRPFVTGSAPANPTQKSVHAWRANEAAEFALCCGPELCLPSTDEDFYIRAFVHGVASGKRRI